MSAPNIGTVLTTLRNIGGNIGWNNGFGDPGLAGIQVLRLRRSQAKPASWRALATVLSQTFRSAVMARLQKATVTTARPRSFVTSCTSSFRVAGESFDGRPPAFESWPRHPRVLRALARTFCTMRSHGCVPSFFRTALAISSGPQPAFLYATICPRANASS